MGSDSATIGWIGNLASKCFSYGIQGLIFGPLIIGIVAKMFPKVGMMFDNLFGGEPEPEHGYDYY
jgi:hypothetical protein